MIEVHQIAEKEFVPSLRGYNRGEVRAFLRAVARDYQRLLERILPDGPPIEKVTQTAHAEQRSTITASHDFEASQRLAVCEVEQAAARLDELLTLLRAERSTQRVSADLVEEALSHCEALTDGVMDVDHVERESQPGRAWRRSECRTPLFR